MAATTGLVAASMAWIIGTSGGPDIFFPNSLMSAPTIKMKDMMPLTGAQTEHCKNIRRYHFRFHSSSKCLLLELHLFYTAETT